MKKIKITQEQYKKISKLISENVNIPDIPNMGKKVDKSFKQAFVGKDVQNLKEDGTDFKIEKPIPKFSKTIQGKFMKENVGDLKHETLELIKYLYRKSEDFSPFWAEHDLTYDDICDELESKGIIIKKDGKYELSKSLGSAEKAKQAVEDELSKMIGGELTEYDNYNYPMGADANPNAPWNQKDPSYTRASINPNQLAFEGVHLNQEFAILKDKSGDLYALYYDNIPEEDLNSISDELGFTEKEYVGKDEDGMPDFEYHYNWQNDDDEKLAILAAYADSVANEAGEGLDDWESGIELVKIDDTFKNELLDLYDKDSKLTSILSGVNEIDVHDILGKPFKQQPRGYEEKSPEEIEMIKQRLADLKNKEQLRRDKEDADFKHMLANPPQPKTKDDVTSKTLPVEPKKPVGQYNMFGGIDEMGTAGAMGGPMGANVAANAGAYTTAMSTKPIKKEMPIVTKNVPVVKENLNEMTQGNDATGQYTMPAFKMKKNHTDFAEVNPKAFQKTQYADGSFVEFNDCVKLNNKPAGTGCSAGAVDGVVKQRKTKGNVNAPSLGENKIYETIAKQTGKTIDEVKRIIESKKNK